MVELMNRLNFRGQFILAKDPIEELRGWNIIIINSFRLYVHPDIEVNQAEEMQNSIVLIRKIFDPYNFLKDNSTILKDILNCTSSTKDILLKIKRYAGSYVIIGKIKNEFNIWSDARATQEIYYCTNSNQIVCGSQPNLIARFSNPVIEKTKDSLVLDFYENYLFDSRWVGIETCFENIRHLLPNHYLNIHDRRPYRYWPNSRIELLSIQEAVSKSCKYLKGIMKSIVHRYSVMMAVTAGTDSRTLLAASREVLDNIYCFVNNRGLGYFNPDIEIPNKIFKDIGKKFHVHDVPEDVDDEFRKIYLNNTFLANERLLPSIYNVFYRGYQDKILILGVGEIGRTFYGLQPKKLNSHRMASKLGYSDCPYVIDQFDKYISEMLPIANSFGINAMIILYWEQRLGNWGAVRNSESKIAIEKIDPFNSHLLNEIFLGVNEKYKNYQESLCILFKEMIKSMWPELLEYPVNPSISLRDRIKSGLMMIGAYEILKELKYQVSYMRFRYRRKR
jgi:hypothetical protein